MKYLKFIDVLLIWLYLGFTEAAFDARCFAPVPPPDNTVCTPNQPSPSEVCSNQLDGPQCGRNKFCCYDYQVCKHYCKARNDFWECDPLSTSSKKCPSDQFCCYNEKECKYECVIPSYCKDVCPETETCELPGCAILGCLEGKTCCEKLCNGLGGCSYLYNHRAECPTPTTSQCPQNSNVPCISHDNCSADTKLCCPNSSNTFCCQEPDYEPDYLTVG